MDDIERIKKALHGIRDYIVRGPDWNPDWYNEVMDDIHFIQDWFDGVKEANKMLDANEEAFYDFVEVMFENEAKKIAGGEE